LKIIAIVGSLRPKGNTEFVLGRALERLCGLGFEVELIPLRGKTILPCLGCLGCKEKGFCVQEDDFAAILDKVMAADGVIVGSPVYVSSAAPPLMALLDRLTYVTRNTGKSLAGKVGAPIVVGRRAGHNFTFAQLLLWYFISEMIIPGSSYWNIVVAGAAGARDAEKDEEGLRTIDRFVDNMAGVLRKMAC
jgi:multimeric flavodoxin WrbA